MSFILDALRKSENERQRSAVPGISHVPFAVTRHQLPGWAVAIIVVLGFSVLGLGVAWWKSSRSDADSTSVAGTVNVPIAIPQPRVQQRTAPAEAQPPNNLANRPLANLANRQETDAADPALEPGESGPSARVTVAQPQSTTAWQALPTASDLIADGIAIPELRLELHVYYPDRPADRFVIINGTRYRQGEVMTEGPRVVTIESTGAVLNHRGREFLLSPE